MVTEQILSILFNLEIFLLFIGGIFALILTVTIIYSKQEYKRSIERDRLQELSKQKPELVGDIEEKLNESFAFKKLNYTDLLTVNGLQPLFIIGFVNLFTSSGIAEVIIVFILIVWTLMHEFSASAKYSGNRVYQFFLLAAWVILFAFMSYSANNNFGAT